MIKKGEKVFVDGVLIYFFVFRLSNRTVVDNGLSLNGTSLNYLKHNRLKDHSVRCLLNVENWSAWRLKDALPHNHCGYIDEMYTAVNVMPATREVMLGYKQVLGVVRKGR